MLLIDTSSIVSTLSLLVVFLLIGVCIGSVDSSNDSQSTEQEERKSPHVVFILVDDLGWGDVGWHNPNNPEVQTPTMDRLGLEEGMILERHYVHNTCEGTRSSAQSGRLPVHVQTTSTVVEYVSSGIPYNMTGIAEYMKEGGYATHFVGKWNAGMATPKHTPHGRGYDTSLNYFTHENDYWSQSCLYGPCCRSFWNNPLQANLTSSLVESFEEDGYSLENSSDLVDLWDTNGPAREVNGTGYEEFIFRDRILDILDMHNQSDPLFLYYAPHVAHCPLQVPQQYLDKFDFITNDSEKCIDTTYSLPHEPYTVPNITQSCRKQYRSMVNLLDDIIGELEAKLIEKGLWNDTLLVLTSDNGGPIDIYETGATNFGLRGGKNTDWEGGIRAAAFVSGGYIPEELRGTNLTEPIHIADWYATLPALAGVEVKAHGDHEDFTLPQVDAVNVWPYVIGEVDVSPRLEIPVSLYTLVSGDYKLIWRKSVSGAGWSDRDWPNATSEQSDVEDVTHNCTHGCLFNVRVDKAERYDISSEHPTLLQALKMRLFEVREYYYSNEDDFDNSCPDDTDVPCSCWMAINQYDGYYGPYAKLDE